MLLGHAGANQRLADLHRERMIHDTERMHVADFALANPELNPAKAVRVARDSRLRRGILNQRDSSIHA